MRKKKEEKVAVELNSQLPWKELYFEEVGLRIGGGREYGQDSSGFLLENKQNCSTSSHGRGGQLSGS